MTKPTSLPRIELSAKLETTLLAGHPWVFRQQLPGRVTHAAGWVWVRAGKYEGVGFYEPDSVLALRMYSWGRVPDEAWFAERFALAWNRRARVRAQDTSAFRWCNGEGDGVPGLVVDHYAGFAVVVCDTPGLEPLLPLVGRALASVTPLLGVLYRKRGADKGERLSCVQGSLPPRKLAVEEHGLRLVADLFEGQKTGLFLDHRENRREFGSWAKGKRVLNLFSYTGGFSLYAAQAGASEVVSVDQAPQAAEDAQENFRLNGFEPAEHAFVVADVFEYLAQAASRGERFDLIVCDPPSFARSVRHLDKAKAAYTRVNAQGIRLLEPDGVYAAASCTARISPSDFLQNVAAAASKARRVFQVLFEGGQASDHPYRAAHPEGRYLKFLLGSVPPRW